MKQKSVLSIIRYLFSVFAVLTLGLQGVAYSRTILPSTGILHELPPAKVSVEITDKFDPKSVPSDLRGKVTHPFQITEDEMNLMLRKIYYVEPGRIGVFGEPQPVFPHTSIYKLSRDLRKMLGNVKKNEVVFFQVWGGQDRITGLTFVADGKIYLKLGLLNGTSYRRKGSNEALRESLESSPNRWELISRDGQELVNDSPGFLALDLGHYKGAALAKKILRSSTPSVAKSEAAETPKTETGKVYPQLIRLTETLLWTQRPPMVPGAMPLPEVGPGEPGPSMANWTYSVERKREVLLLKYRTLKALKREAKISADDFRLRYEALARGEEPVTAAGEVLYAAMETKSTSVPSQVRFDSRKSIEPTANKKREILLTKYHALKQLRRGKVISEGEYQLRRAAMARGEEPVLSAPGQMAFAAKAGKPSDAVSSAPDALSQPSLIKLDPKTKKEILLAKYHELKRQRREKSITEEEYQRRREALARGEDLKAEPKEERFAQTEINDFGDVYHDFAVEYGREQRDRFEGFNRSMFKFNNFMYDHFFEPVAMTYRDVTDEDFRGIVKSFFDNVKMPIRLVSSIIQGDAKKAGRTLSRFFINTTLGLGGMVDVAKSEFKIKPVNEDFDQALGYHRVKTGPYLVLPILGPTTTRGVLGLLVDNLFNPTWYFNVFQVNQRGNMNFITDSGEKVNYISQNIGLKEEIDDFALDPYLSVRDMYLQYNSGKVRE